MAESKENITSEAKNVAVDPTIDDLDLTKSDDGVAYLFVYLSMRIKNLEQLVEQLIRAQNNHTHMWNTSSLGPQFVNRLHSTSTSNIKIEPKQT
jgi:hypothetical protein